MDIDARRLIVLAEVARRGGVLAAAQALHVTPSAVSQQLSRLESEVGLALTVRVGRGMDLTAAGLQLSRRGARVADELRGARADVVALSEGVHGHVVVAGFPSGIAALAVPMIGLLAGTHPGVRVRLREIPAEVAGHELLAGAVDLELTERDPEDEHAVPDGLGETALLDDAYVLALPPGVRAPRTAAELAASTWVQGPPGSTTRAVLDRLSAGGGWQPNVVHEALEYPAILAMVAGGLGCALVPWLVAASARDVGTRVVQVPGLGSRRIGLRYRSARHEPSRAAWAVHQALVATAEQITASPRAHTRVPPAAAATVEATVAQAWQADAGD